MRWKTIWVKHKGLLTSLMLMAVLLICKPLLIGNKPLLCKYENEWYFLMLAEKPGSGSLLAQDLSAKAQGDYRQLYYGFSWWPMILKDPAWLDPGKAWQGPFTRDSRNQLCIFGTYELGRDVLAGCLTGFYNSMCLALLSMLWSLLFGLILSSSAVYQSARASKISVISALSAFLLVAWTVVVIMSAIEIRITRPEYYWITIAVGLCAATLIYLASGWGPRIKWPIDRFNLAYIEIMKSIPALIFLLILIQMFPRPNPLTLSLIIAFLYLPVIMKYARAFTQRMVTEPFLDAIMLSGASHGRIFWRHLFPRLLWDMVPVAAFGLSNIILLETSLSFLGLGFSLERVSLGSILHSARLYPSAWWVVVFPGAMVFWMVYTLQSFGNACAASKFDQPLEPRA